MRAEGKLNSASRPHEPSLATCLIVLLLVIVFFGAIRWRLRDMPLERDEGEYAYAGQLMLEGIPPYALAYNMKLPGIYAAYAAVMAVFGQTPAGIHLGLLLANATTVFLVFLLAARLFGGITFGRVAAAVAGCSYALLSTSTSVMGFEAHATNFVVVPALLGILLMLRGMEGERWWLIFLSGFCTGVGFLMKQHGIFFVLFGLVWLAWNGEHLPLVVKRWGVFGVGAILPYLATCVLMWRAGVFPQFWFWTVEYAGEYSKMGLRRAVRAFLENSQIVMSAAWPIWVLAVIGLSAIWWSSAARRQARFLILLLVCSFLSLCPGAYFRPHYYILLLPAVAILTGVGIAAIAEKLSAARSQKLEPAVGLAPKVKSGAILAALLTFIACFAFSIVQQRAAYFSLSPEAVVRSIYGENAFVPAIRIADYIRANSPADARIAVIGSEPEIYFYSHRHSATGYLYMYSLIVHHKFTGQMRDQMMRELETNRPLYVVYVDVWDDWGPREGGPQLAEFVPRLREFMERSYEVVGVASVGESTKYYWDADARNYRPDSSQAVYVLRRKVGS